MIRATKPSSNGTATHNCAHCSHNHTYQQGLCSKGDLALALEETLVPIQATTHQLMRLLRRSLARSPSPRAVRNAYRSSSNSASLQMPSGGRLGARARTGAMVNRVEFSTSNASSLPPWILPSHQHEEQLSKSQPLLLSLQGCYFLDGVSSCAVSHEHAEKYPSLSYGFEVPIDAPAALYCADTFGTLQAVSVQQRQGAGPFACTWGMLSIYKSPALPRCAPAAVVAPAHGHVARKAAFLQLPIDLSISVLLWHAAAVVPACSVSKAHAETASTLSIRWATRGHRLPTLQCPE